ncbi:MAG: hypothetical protein Kow0059_21200 [Candidatus Sumerlaeia bacterium]
MPKVWAIARTTFKEAIRNRILYILLIFALLLMASSGVISDLSIAAHDRIIKDLGVFGISAFGLLIAVFVGISLIYNEMDKKTIYTIISKPINRSEYLLGKFLGLLLTIYVIMLFMTFFFMAVVYYFQYMSDENLTRALWRVSESGEYRYAGFGAYLFYIVKAVVMSAVKALGTILLVYHSEATANILAVVCYSALELAIVTAFAILFSTFTSPTLSAIFTVLTFIIGRMNEDIVRYALHVLDKEGPTLKYHVANAAALVAPNFGVFNKSAELIYSDTPIGFDAIAVGYGVLYLAAVLMLAMLVFRRRNLK